MAVYEHECTLKFRVKTQMSKEELMGDPEWAFVVLESSLQCAMDRLKIEDLRGNLKILESVILNEGGTEDE